MYFRACTFLLSKEIEPVLQHLPEYFYFYLSTEYLSTFATSGQNTHSNGTPNSKSSGNTTLTQRELLRIGEKPLHSHGSRLPELYFSVK